MAFVFMSEKRWSPLQSKEPNVGPGSYEVPTKHIKINPMQQANAPFNKGDLRDIDKNNQNQTPGPGDYLLEQDTKNQLLKPKQLMNSIFKSEIERFYVKDKGVPDLGIYTKEFEFQKEKYQKEQEVIEYLKSKKHHPRQQQPPSIPSNPNQFLDPNFKLQNKQHDKVKQQQQKIAQSKSFIQGGAWSRQKEKKFINHFKSDTQKEVGPGKYNQNQDQTKIFQKKATHQFMSSTLRSTQEKTGFKANQFLLQKLKNEAMQLAENETEIYQIEDQKITRDNFIAKEHQNPGPGYYHKDQQQKKAKNQMNNQLRFPEQRCYSSCAPGEYNNIGFNTFYKTSQGQFLDGKKFQETIKDIPGPGAYALKNQINDNLKKNKEKWDFQMTKRVQEQQFKPDFPGPGHYQNPDYISRLNELDLISGKTQHQFLSNYQRNDYIKKIDNLDPGTYEQSYYTIQGQLKKQKLGLKEVPFLKALPTNKAKVEDQQEEPEEVEIIKNAVRKRKEKVIFQNFSKEQKFRQPKKYTQRIGPGQYNNQKRNSLIKKTYNMHFIET